MRPNSSAVCDANQTGRLGCQPDSISPLAMVSTAATPLALSNAPENQPSWCAPTTIGAPGSSRPSTPTTFRPRARGLTSMSTLTVTVGGLRWQRSIRPTASCFRSTASGGASRVPARHRRAQRIRALEAGASVPRGHHHRHRAAAAQLEADLADSDRCRSPVDQRDRATQIEPVEAVAATVADEHQPAGDAGLWRGRRAGHRRARVAAAARHPQRRITKPPAVHRHLFEADVGQPDRPHFGRHQLGHLALLRRPRRPEPERMRAHRRDRGHHPPQQGVVDWRGEWLGQACCRGRRRLSRRTPGDDARL